MAAGYARARPPVHPEVMRLVGERLGFVEPVRVAVDVGCGAGRSSTPLLALARTVVGLDPVPAMARAAAIAGVDGSGFGVAVAEALPVRSGSVDLLAAAGSLDFVDLDRFLPEARRVLRPGATLLAYDFAPGRAFPDSPDSPALDAWFTDFRRRYPPAPRAELDLTTTPGFRWLGHEPFTVELPMSPESYVEYAMTETNVAAAIGRGTAAADIRTWCATSLAPVFGGVARLIAFTGSFTWFEPT
jgi:ubiquinone/menaquinone biosynthesis C-methylase UbiE